MNTYQQLARQRQARRFSTGDGVKVMSGPHKGRKGYICAVGGWSAYDLQVGEGPVHSVWFTDTPNDPKQLNCGLVSEAELDGDPAGNRGKYGGPSRGGASEGWRGSSRYRVHGRRR